MYYKNNEVASVMLVKNNEWIKTASAIRNFGYNGGGYKIHTLGEWKTEADEDIFTIIHWHREEYGKDSIRVRFNKDKSKLTLQFLGPINEHYFGIDISDEFVKI